MHAERQLRRLLGHGPRIIPLLPSLHLLPTPGQVSRAHEWLEKEVGSQGELLGGEGGSYHLLPLPSYYCYWMLLRMHLTEKTAPLHLPTSLFLWEEAVMAVQVRSERALHFPLQLAVEESARPIRLHASLFLHSGGTVKGPVFLCSHLTMEERRDLSPLPCTSLLL